MGLTLTFVKFHIFVMTLLCRSPYMSVKMVMYSVPLIAMFMYRMDWSVGEWQTQRWTGLLFTFRQNHMIVHNKIVTSVWLFLKLNKNNVLLFCYLNLHKPRIASQDFCIQLRYNILIIFSHTSKRKWKFWWRM